MKIKRKKFDSVKMMRKIRQNINKDIVNMSVEEILEYIKKDKSEYSKLISKKKSNVEHQS